jgi:hypothetical protein
MSNESLTKADIDKAIQNTPSKLPFVYTMLIRLAYYNSIRNLPKPFQGNPVKSMGLTLYFYKDNKQLKAIMSKLDNKAIPYNIIT